MTLNSFMRWLKEQPTTKDIPMELGSLNRNKPEFIALVPTGGIKSAGAFGVPGSYGVTGVTIRLRYGANFTTAQTKARRLQSLFEKIENTDMAGTLVYFAVNEGEPVYNGRDVNGVVEFTLKVKLYFERRG